MPLYEYTCNHCNESFEALVRTAEDSPKCPHCGQIELTKLFSVPASAKVQGSGTGLPMCPPAMPSGGCSGPACQGGFCGGMG